MEKPKDNHPDSRMSDFVLYARYIQENNEELRNVGLIYALMEASALNMPNFESITRIRRKIQRQQPELKPPKKTQALREDREKMFREYARKN